MKKLFRNPALVIAALALFIALGGGAAVAGTLISGKQIENHSVGLSQTDKPGNPSSARP